MFLSYFQPLVRALTSDTCQRSVKAALPSLTSDILVIQFVYFHSAADHRVHFSSFVLLHLNTPFQQLTWLVDAVHRSVSAIDIIYTDASLSRIARCCDTSTSPPYRWRQLRPVNPNTSKRRELSKALSTKCCKLMSHLHIHTHTDIFRKHRGTKNSVWNVLWWLNVIYSIYTGRH